MFTLASKIDRFSIRVRTIPVLDIGRYLRVSLLGDTVFSTSTRYFHSRYRQVPPIVQ